MNGKYILEGKKPKLVEDALEWARWFETADRHVAQTILPSGVRVSTVFLGLDHSFCDGEPILFETMVFGKCKYDEYQERYSTYEEAEIGHARIVKMVELEIG